MRRKLESETIFLVSICVIIGIMMFFSFVLGIDELIKDTDATILEWIVLVILFFGFYGIIVGGSIFVIHTDRKTNAECKQKSEMWKEIRQLNKEEQERKFKESQYQFRRKF